MSLSSRGGTKRRRKKVKWWLYIMVNQIKNILMEAFERWNKVSAADWLRSSRCVNDLRRHRQSSHNSVSRKSQCQCGENKVIQSHRKWTFLFLHSRSPHDIRVVPGRQKITLRFSTIPSHSQDLTRICGIPSSHQHREEQLFNVRFLLVQSRTSRVIKLNYFDSCFQFEI